MIILPAIDLRHGRCVMLHKGDPKTEVIVGEDPAQMARHWVEQGAEWLHVVNLDGALEIDRPQIDSVGRPSNILVKKLNSQIPEDGNQFTHYSSALDDLPINLRRLHEIRNAVTQPIQFGGGLRTLEDIELALLLGANRVVLGTVAVENPDLVAAAIRRWGADKIAVGLDAKECKVATHGWQRTSKISAVELGHHMHAIGVRRVLYTDIDRDGMLSGANVEATSRLGDTTDLRVIAGGGVANLEDIEQLKAHEHYNIEGVVVGTSIYNGDLDLAKAIEIGKRPLVRHSAGLIPFRMTESRPEFLLLFNLFLEQWQFPRGGLGRSENHTSCAAREFIEETGMQIKQMHHKCRTTLEYTTTIRGYNIERTIVYFLAEVYPSEIRFGNENHCEARWVPYQEAWELLTETSPEQLPALDGVMGYLAERGQI